MKVPTVVYVYGGVAVAAAAVVYVVYRLLKSPFETKGTAYETERSGLPGAVAGIAAATNRLSGGLLAEGGSSLGLTLYDWTHDSESGPDIMLGFTFTATGTKGSVDSKAVAPDGVFTYWRDGKKYRLRVDADGQRFATGV